MTSTTKHAAKRKGGGQVLTTKPKQSTQIQDQDFMIQDQDQNFHCCP